MPIASAERSAMYRRRKYGYTIKLKKAELNLILNLLLDSDHPDSLAVAENLVTQFQNRIYRSRSE